MNIRLEHEPYVGWIAYLPDEYDGAPDAGPQIEVRGKTIAECLAELAAQLEERDA